MSWADTAEYNAVQFFGLQFYDSSGSTSYGTTDSNGSWAGWTGFLSSASCTIDGNETDSSYVSTSNSSQYAFVSYNANSVSDLTDGAIDSFSSDDEIVITFTLSEDLSDTYYVGVLYSASTTAGVTTSSWSYDADNVIAINEAGTYTITYTIDGSIVSYETPSTTTTTTEETTTTDTSDNDDITSS